MGAWRALLLFPGGVAPEPLLRAAAGEEGPDALRDAALADFDPALQAWRWHGTVGEYARLRWPLSDDERRARLGALLPEWKKWLEEKFERRSLEAISQIEMYQVNLELILKDAKFLPREQLLDLLKALHEKLPLPQRTVGLWTFNEHMYRVWAEYAVSPEDQAHALNMLGHVLLLSGRFEEALSETTRAVEIYRRLFSDSARPVSQDTRIHFAHSLSTQGSARWALAQQQLEKALRATKEAARLYGQLQAPPDLATSLNNLDTMLCQIEGALAATQEAVGIYRELAAANPPAFLPYLATSLNNLGYMLSALGRREEALAAMQEAVEICRKLAEANPQAFRPDLAISLTNLGYALSALGRWEEALAATQEAVEICRKLAEANPQAFLPDLAGSLGVHGRVLLESGRAQEACVAFGEGLQIILPFAQVFPAAFGRLAAALREGYLRACQALGLEPDEELLRPIREHLEE